MSDQAPITARPSREPVERQTYSVDEAARLLGISRTTAYECVRDGSLPSLRFRKRVVVTKATINELLARVANPTSTCVSATSDPRS